VIAPVRAAQASGAPVQRSIFAEASERERHPYAVASGSHGRNRGTRQIC
jgi:hypothetical protein